MESTSHNIYVARDLNSIESESGRSVSTTNDSTFSDMKTRVLYNSCKLKEIICVLETKKCLPPSVTEILIKDCEKITEENAFSARLRDLSHVLQLSMLTCMTSKSAKDPNKKFWDLDNNMTLSNRIKPLEKSNKKENELMMVIQDLEKIPPPSKRHFQRRLAITPNDLSAEEKLAWACQKNLQNKCVDKGHNGLHLTKQNRRARKRVLAKKKMAGAFDNMGSLVNALPSIDKKVKNRSVKEKP